MVPSRSVALAGMVATGLAGASVLRRRRMADLRGQVVLIAGGSRGLGYLMAKEFASLGCSLVLCARGAETLERARAEIEAMGADVLAVPCDVANRAEVERVVDAARQRFGRIDILVNNASIITMGPIAAMTADDFAAAMDITFWGALHATMAVLPEMRQRRSGRIVNITSIGGRVSAPHLLPYNAAKFALVSLSEGLRAELARDGIVVTTVVPGFMRTGSHVNAMFKGRHRAEFTLFSLLGTLPVSSMSAPAAARQIVTATRRGDAEIILTPQAQLLSRLHGLMPGSFVQAMSLATRLLPDAGPEGTQPAVPGRDSGTFLSESFLTALGRKAARRFHQYSERASR